MATKRTKTTGIDVRHTRSCAVRSGRDCNCNPTYQANVYDARAKRLIRKTFPTFTGARNWRQDALVALRGGTLRASEGRTVEQVASEWLRALAKVSFGTARVTVTSRARSAGTSGISDCGWFRQSAA